MYEASWMRSGGVNIHEEMSSWRESYVPGELGLNGPCYCE